MIHLLREDTEDVPVCDLAADGEVTDRHEDVNCPSCLAIS